MKQNDVDVDYACGGPMQGFNILVHAPTEASQEYMTRSFHVPLGKASYYVIKPSFTYTSLSVQKMSPNERNCYLGTERKLRFYKFYSQSYCELECLHNFTLSQCGCILFSMERK